MARFYRLVLRAKKLKDNSTIKTTVKWFRDLNLQQPYQLLTGNCQITREMAGDMPVYTLLPPGSNSNKTVLFIHGGGFVGGPHLFHWHLAGKIARAANCRIIVPVYPLAPEHPYPAAVNALFTLYRQLAGQYGNPPALMGDSAGGNLALVTALKLNDEKLPLPPKLVLLSPCLDQQLNNPDIDALEEQDAMLNRKAAQTTHSAYIGNNAITHPYISPVFGNLANLPPILLLCGTKEIFYPDCLRFTQMLQQQGGNIEFLQGENLFHDWPMFPLLPEASTAIAAIARFLA